MHAYFYGEVGGWGRVPFSKNLMSPTPRRKWYLTTGRRAHYMVLDPIPQSLPVHFFGSRSQPPTSRTVSTQSCVCDRQLVCLCSVVVFICVKKTDVMNQKVHKLCVCVSVYVTCVCMCVCVRKLCVRVSLRKLCLRVRLCLCLCLCLCVCVCVCVCVLNTV